MWFNEFQNYNYSSNTCPKGQCTHYTQVSIGTTTIIFVAITNSL